MAGAPSSAQQAQAALEAEAWNAFLRAFSLAQSDPTLRNMHDAVAAFERSLRLGGLTDADLAKTWGRS